MKKIISATFLFFALSIASMALAAELEVVIYPSNQTASFDAEKKVREYVFNETCYTAFFVKGFSRNPDGSIDLTSHVKCIDPKGNILFDEKDYAKAKSAPADVEFINLDTSFDVTIEDGDPVGMYVIEVEVVDTISKENKIAQTTVFYFDTNESKNLIMKPVKTAEDLDNLWAEYFRSKNPWAVKRIISALRLRKESPKLEDAVVGAAAKWSLESNAKQHPDILEICKQSLKNTKGAINELLQEIIANAEK
ncbi:hypothetical protein ACFL1E_00975 [Candidatus Omnitrophota bacterium]